VRLLPIPAPRLREADGGQEDRRDHSEPPGATLLQHRVSQDGIPGSGRDREDVWEEADPKDNAGKKPAVNGEGQEVFRGDIHPQEGDEGIAPP